MKRSTFTVLSLPSLLLLSSLAGAEPARVSLSAIPSPILFRGNATTAYRDPAVVYHDGWFRLFFTLVQIESDQQVFLYTAWSKSRDLATWTAPVIFTPRDQRLNFSSPGNLVQHNGDWILCLQTYPRPNGERHGNQDSRIWTMRSKTAQRSFELPDTSFPRGASREGKHHVPGYREACVSDYH